MDTTISARARLVAALALACALLACVGLVGCGGSTTYNDGTYTGQSETLDDGSEASGYGVAEVTITDGAISACTFTTYETDGTLKDDSYGQSLAGNEGKYKMAQAAVKACDTYAQQLVETGNVDQVDTVSGATVNHDEFVEAVDDALSQAAA